jgi:glycosyltransferase involved in cell wall biosynthesis
MNHLVSIIVPAYNVENYIENCIRSVLRQTYKDWELIIIDDGSTDQTGPITDRFAEEYEKIIVFHQTNLGVSTARNKGIDLAHGDYFLFLDSDDWLDDDMLQTMMTEGSPSDLIVCGVNDCYREENGTITVIPRRIWDIQDCFSTDNVYQDVFCETAALWNKLISRDCIKNIRFVPEMSYGEDPHFLAMILPNVRSCIIVPNSLYNYLRQREGSVVSARIDERSLRFLDNTVETYRFLRSVKKGKYGVFRIKAAAHEVLNKIDDLDDDSYLPYIRKCGHALRQTAFRDMVSCILDSKLQKTIASKIYLLLLTHFPKLATKLKRKKGKRSLR